MGFFDKVKDVLTTSDKERADKAAKDAAAAREKAAEAASKAGDPADSTSVQDAAEAREKAERASREAAEKQAKAEEKAAEKRAEEQEKAAEEKAEAKSYRTYTVKSGDTLSGIAAKHGVDWREMATLNKLDNPDLIYPGQVFKVPHS